MRKQSTTMKKNDRCPIQFQCFYCRYCKKIAWSYAEITFRVVRGSIFRIRLYRWRAVWVTLHSWALPHLKQGWEVAYYQYIQLLLIISLCMSIWTLATFINRHDRNIFVVRILKDFRILWVVLVFEGSRYRMVNHFIAKGIYEIATD